MADGESMCHHVGREDERALESKWFQDLLGECELIGPARERFDYEASQKAALLYAQTAPSGVSCRNSAIRST